MKNKRLVIILGIAGALLLLPLIAMQFTTETIWTGFDFFVAAVLLFGTGLTIELVLRKIRSSNNRFIILGIILAVIFLIWAELGVGVFGTPISGS